MHSTGNDVAWVGPGSLVAATPGEHLRRSLEALKVPTLALARRTTHG